MKSDFAGTLKSLRLEKGFSQRRAADELGVSQALLSHYENNAREPKLEFVVKVCDYYGVTADYILGRVDDRNIQPLPRPCGCDSAPRFISALCSIFEKLEDLSDPELYAAAVDYLAISTESVSALLHEPFMLYDPMRDAEQKIAESALLTKAKKKTGKKW